MRRSKAQASPSRFLPALPLAAAAAIALLAGLTGGLVRMGWPLLPAGAVAPVALHGALMVCGFFGFVISLERAAALCTPLAWAAPVLAAAGTVGALALQPGAAALSWLAAGTALTLVYAGVLRKAPALHTAVEGAGALAWAGGTLWWLLDRPFSTVLAWWCAFLVLTIAGERRELARFVPLSTSARRLYLAVLALQAAALVALAVPWQEHPVAAAAWWLSMAGLAGWLLRFDLACRAGVQRTGWGLHTAACLRLGYGWLALAGVWGVVDGLRGMPLDAPGPLHMLLLGFVFAMVFGHAPIVLPVLLHRRIAAPGRYTLVPVWLMSAGVALRAVGDLAALMPLRAGAGALQVAAIVVFAATMIAHLRR
ncbi:hypothetical protein [uncultured Piscinibacter sp.]|uniref:hypothetical protein n=1 Tax=uncultured Piscinibacter sp. TaxID=1131835 RepID=UPI002630F3F5|nr:hypothetical protein [uncultured Piscinibacter sp.]